MFMGGLLQRSAVVSLHARVVVPSLIPDHHQFFFNPAGAAFVCSLR
jgi:hypothetical protein